MMANTKPKEIYLSPVTEVYELLSEGIMTTSNQNAGGEDMEWDS